MRRRGRGGRWRAATLALVAAALLAAALAACADVAPTPAPTPTPTPRPALVRLAGDTSMHPVALALIAGQAAADPEGALYTLDESSSRDGLAEVREGRAEIGLVARDLDAAALAGEGLLAVPIALDGLVVVVHQANPASAFSMDELRRLYAGRWYNWSVVGGLDQEVQLVAREEGSDARQVFDAKALQGEPLTRNSLALPTGEAVAEYVATHPEAVGYVALNGLRPGIKGLLLQGVPPDDASIRGGAYPLTRPLYWVIRGDAGEAVKALVSYAVGAEGQRIIGGHHVPLYQAGDQGL